MTRQKGCKIRHVQHEHKSGEMKRQEKGRWWLGKGRGARGVGWDGVSITVIDKFYFYFLFSPPKSETQMTASVLKQDPNT